MVQSSPSSLLKEMLSADLFASVMDRWTAKAIVEADQTMLSYFLSRGECSPQISPCVAHEDTSLEHMFDILCKLVLYAPEVWYEAVVGRERPPSLKNDSAGLGVAFDASGRLRRAGIEYYHEQLTAKTISQWPCLAHESAFYIDALGARKEACSLCELPEKQPQTVRIVAVSDTHECHRRPTIPQGDLLVHAGDLGFEESRSLGREAFEDFARQGAEALAGPKFHAWFQQSALGLSRTLQWLGELPGFRYKVLVAGNHDYILEQLGKENSTELCQKYGVIYLHHDYAPWVLRFDDDLFATVWGSAVSRVSQLDTTRAVLSANNSFQVNRDEANALLTKCDHVLSKDVDIMVTHGPPEGFLLGKPGKTLPEVNELISRVKPSLYVCGHAHNTTDPLFGRFANINGVLGVNAACCSEWCHFHGLPIVIDRFLRQTVGPHKDSDMMPGHVNKREKT